MLNIEQKLDQVNSENLFIDVVTLRKNLDRRNILFWRERKTEKEKKEDIWTRKKYLRWRRRKKEKEMEESIWREYIFVRKVFEEGKLMLTPTKQPTGQILWNMPFRRLENIIVAK